MMEITTSNSISVKPRLDRAGDKEKGRQRTWSVPRNERRWEGMGPGSGEEKWREPPAVAVGGDGVPAVKWPCRPPIPFWTQGYRGC